MAFQCLNDWYHVWPSGLPHHKLFESLIYIEQDNANMNTLAEYVIKESWSLDVYVIDESWSWIDFQVSPQNNVNEKTNNN
jgi:hypothetical protein